MTSVRPVLERFNEKWCPEPFSGCWLWTACATSSRGTKGSVKLHYGRFRANGLMDKAHRVSWRLFRGEIPEFLHVLHDCDTTLCVNPDHLSLGTNFDNHRDAALRGRKSREEHRPNSKLTDEAVREIRSFGGRYKATLARKFGVSKTAVKLVLRRKTWTHVK